MAANCVHLFVATVDCFFTLRFPVQYKQIDGICYIMLIVLSSWLISAVCIIPFIMSTMQSDDQSIQVKHIDHCRVRSKQTYLVSGVVPSYYIWVPIIGVVCASLLCLINQRRHDAVAIQTENSLYGHGHTQSTSLGGIANGDEHKPANGINHNGNVGSNGHVCRINESELSSDAKRAHPTRRIEMAIRRNRCDTIDSITDIDLTDPNNSGPQRCNSNEPQDCYTKSNDVTDENTEDVKGESNNQRTQSFEQSECINDEFKSDNGTLKTIVAEIHEPYAKAPKMGKEQLNEPLDHDDIYLINNINEQYLGEDNYSYEDQNPLSDLIQVRIPLEKGENEINDSTQEYHKNDGSTTKENCLKVTQISRERRSILKRENSAKQTKRNVQFAISISECAPVMKTKILKRKPTGRYRNDTKWRDKLPKNAFEYLTQAEVKNQHSAKRLYRHKATVWLLCTMYIVFVLLSVPFLGIYTVLSVCVNCHISHTVQISLEWLYYSHSWFHPLLYCIFHHQLKRSGSCQHMSNVEQ